MERPETEAQILELQDAFGRVRREIGRVIVGQADLVEDCLTSLLCGGHILLEGVPGLGKTLLVRTISETTDLTFSRIQFTPDLMPADITGTNVLVQEPDGRRRFEFQKGPLFAQIVLADEINRATPKTQSALLEAMQEHRVTVAGQEHPLREPFFVLATQNPIEMEGTYPLPEAQIDRFLFKLRVAFPTLAELSQIVDRTTGQAVPRAARVVGEAEILKMQALTREVPIASHVKEYALQVVWATHPSSPTAPDAVKQYVEYGASPRGAQAVVLAAKARALLAGRFNVSIQDVQRSLLPALRHRLILNFEAEASGVNADALLEKILDAVPAGEAARSQSAPSIRGSA